MRLLTTRQALHRLGLDERADRGKARRAYRRLAKQVHPDVCPGPAAARRFIEISEAYQFLVERLPERAETVPEACPGCGGAKPVGSLLDGRRGCADCLLGRTVLRRRLPGPLPALSRPLTAIGLYLCGWLLVSKAWQTGVALMAAAGVLSVWSGVVLLALPLVVPSRGRRRGSLVL